MTRTVAMMTLDELVDRFVKISVEQGKALAEFRTRDYNRLFDRKWKILTELKSRPGDQRRVLFDLYDHENIQVRLDAARSTFAIDPVAGRAKLQEILDSKIAPWCFHAAMDLKMEDAGMGKFE